MEGQTTDTMAEDVIRVYVSSVSSNMKIKKAQSRIKMILDSKKIEYQEIDIAVCDEDKQVMRDKCGNPKALPPQIFKGDTYLGDYEAFDCAVEGEQLTEFLLM